MDIVKKLKELTEKLPNPITVEGNSDKLGTICFALRNRKGMSQSELALKAGLDVRIIHRIEGGSKLMSDDIYTTIFELLGTTYEESLLYCETMED